MDLAFGAFPSSPKLTDEALRKGPEMGAADPTPRFGAWESDLLRYLVGWKAAKRLTRSCYI